MNRSASAAPGLNAAKLAFGFFAALLFVTVGGGTIALVGLGQFSGDVDPLRAPAWFWYYRGAPEVRRWLLIGCGSATFLAVLSAAAALLSRRRPLHGAARWATASEQRAAGLRARQGLILGRAREGGFRREVWTQGRAMGLNIKGYQPRDRDRQAAGHPVSRRPLEERLRMASAVVQNLIPDPEAQRRLLNHAAAAIARITDRSGEERRSRTHDRQR